jgi:hypothetical protein
MEFVNETKLLLSQKIISKNYVGDTKIINKKQVAVTQKSSAKIRLQVTQKSLVKIRSLLT